MPISATQIRDNPSANRHWMSREVRAAFVRRIAVLGGESSGKTTLTAALAEHFGTHWVSEYGRELWEQQSGVLSQADLTKIAREQVRREEAGLLDANDYFFCDTSPLTTMGYSGWIFGEVDDSLAAIARRPYDAIVLCCPDFPFVQDGTRRDEGFRQQQHRWYVDQLERTATPVFEAMGSVAQRVESVAAWLSRLNRRIDEDPAT